MTVADLLSQGKKNVALDYVLAMAMKAVETPVDEMPALEPSAAEQTGPKTQQAFRDGDAAQFQLRKRMQQLQKPK